MAGAAVGDAQHAAGAEDRLGFRTAGGDAGLCLPAVCGAATGRHPVRRQADFRHGCAYPQAHGLSASAVVAGGHRVRHCRAGQHPDADHRLHRFRAGRQVHAARQHSGDEARGRAGRDRVRRSGVLRPAGARAGTGDRPAGDDSDAGPAGAAGDHDDYAVGDHHLLLALVAAAADCRRGAGVRWREPLRVSGICQEFPADADPPQAGLSAAGGRQQGSREGAEALRAQQVPDRPLHAASRTKFTKRMSRSPSAS